MIHLIEFNAKVSLQRSVTVCSIMGTNGINAPIYEHIDIVPVATNLLQ